ncbi:MAG: CPBP family intramembrane metalloprotease [Sandaracinaceae bacterium]|nr:CPBP family intramembrane metalloprotease [Sandaracinaceae bacterium]
MRDRLDDLVQRLFPGMGLRPLWLTAFASVAMVLYYHHGGGPNGPRWFIEGSTELFDVPHRAFHEHLWAHLAAVVLLMLAPLAASYWLEGWTPLDLGLGVRGAGKELLVVLALWAVMVPVVWAVHDQGSFPSTYPRFAPAKHSMEMYLLYEGFYLVKWIAWEFFFRGFMLFGFARDFFQRAVLMSTVPFVLMHFGKPEPEVLGALLAGLVLCFIALRSKSIWPGVLLHWLVASTMDFFAAEWWR